MVAATPVKVVGMVQRGRRPAQGGRPRRCPEPRPNPVKSRFPSGENAITPARPSIGSSVRTCSPVSMSYRRIVSSPEVAGVADVRGRQRAAVGGERQVAAVLVRMPDLPAHRAGLDVPHVDPFHLG